MLGALAAVAVLAVPPAPSLAVSFMTKAMTKAVVLAFVVAVLAAAGGERSYGSASAGARWGGSRLRWGRALFASSELIFPVEVTRVKVFSLKHPSLEIEGFVTLSEVSV